MSIKILSISGLLLFLCGSFAFFSFDTRSDYWLLRPVRGDAVGQILERKKEAKFRRAQDSLWFYARPGRPLYQGDYIRTEADSSVDISIDKDKTELHIEADSLLRIYLVNGEFVIQKRKGSFKIVKNSNLVTVIDGLKTQTHESKEIQEVHAAPPPPATEKPKEENQSAEEPPPPEQPQSTPPPPAATKPMAQQPTRFKNYPPEGTILLFTKIPTEIHFSIQTKCEKGCRFQLLRQNQKMFEQDLKPGASAEIDYRMPKAIKDKWSWTLQDNDQQWAGSFTTDKLSPENLKQYLREGKSFEILP